jgi:hypothetical protein
MVSQPLPMNHQINGKPILFLCHQVDDMLIAGEGITNVEAFAKEISTHLKVTFGTKPSVHYMDWILNKWHKIFMCDIHPKTTKGTWME